MEKISRENKAIIYGSVMNLFKIYSAQFTSSEGTLGEITNLEKLEIISNLDNI